MNSSSSCSSDRGRWAPEHLVERQVRRVGRAPHRRPRDRSPRRWYVSGGWSRSGRVVASPAVLAILPISTGYQILGLLHILAVIVAFGPLFIYPSLQRAGAAQAVARLHLRLVAAGADARVGARDGPRRHVRRRRGR